MQSTIVDGISRFLKWLSWGLSLFVPCDFKIQPGGPLIAAMPYVLFILFGFMFFLGGPH